MIFTRKVRSVDVENRLLEKKWNVCIAYTSLGKKLQHFSALVRGQFSEEEEKQAW